MGLRGMLKLYEKMLKNVCTAHDLAVTEADILGFLKNNPDKDTAADIAELKMLSKGAVSKSVDSLIGKGLLQRCPDKQDRRKIHLKITPEADPVISDIIKVQEEFRNAMFDGFTEEEYRQGEKVCLVPELLAMRLGVGVGDKLNLPLYYADYSSSVGDASILGSQGPVLFNIRTAQGELYEVFNEQEYEIVGIYTAEDKGSGSYSAGANEVVIPWDAVPENCWKDNIVGVAPMTGATTSFQIPNGTIQEFQEKWEALGIDDLEIRFYDMGYTQLKENLENRELMSVVFLVSGCVMAVMILCFFSNLFITGQRERIAAERLMGRTKRQCALSILTGMLILSAAGCIAGSAAGWLASERAAESVGDTLEFDRTYSDNAVADAEPEEAPEPPGVGLPCATGAVLLAASAAVSVGYMGKTLKKEPLRMLGEIEE